MYSFLARDSLPLDLRLLFFLVVACGWAEVIFLQESADKFEGRLIRQSRRIFKFRSALNFYFNIEHTAWEFNGIISVIISRVDNQIEEVRENTGQNHGEHVRKVVNSTAERIFQHGHRKTIPGF